MKGLRNGPGPTDNVFSKWQAGCPIIHRVIIKYYIIKKNGLYIIIYCPMYIARRGINWFECELSWSEKGGLNYF